jgi:hypothetical protein
MSPLCSQYFCALMVTQRLMTRETFSTAFHHCRGQLWIGLVGEKQLLVKDYQTYTFLKANGTSGTQSYA